MKKLKYYWSWIFGVVSVLLYFLAFLSVFVEERTTEIFGVLLLLGMLFAGLMGKCENGKPLSEKDYIELGNMIELLEEEMERGEN